MVFDKYFKDYLDLFDQEYPEVWSYKDGCVMTGAKILYEADQDDRYLKSLLCFGDKYVGEDGSVAGFNPSEYNVDQLRCGNAFFFLYEQTGNEKYRKAMDLFMENLKHFPRTEEGSFWHKQIYPYQVWLDGLYMAMPFYLKYDTLYGGRKHYNDIIGQFKRVRRYQYDEEKQLYYHAFDEKRQMVWADKETGLSPCFWLRAEGWFLMALVDCYEIIPEESYDQFRYLGDLYKEALRGILKYQDPESGLFYQLIDRADLPGNYLETSGSAMVAYSVLKACRLGLLQKEKYFELGEQILMALEALMFTVEKKKFHLNGICASAGLGPKEERDGSPEYYLGEPQRADNKHGAAACMMAYGEWKRQI